MARQIAQGELGSLLPERIELVARMYEHMTDDLAGGGSRFSAQNKISALRRFFAWSDSEGVELRLETVADTFIRWTDHLLQRQRVERSFSEGALYDLTRLTATVLDRALDRQASLSKSTRIRKPRGKGKVHTSKADKQNLQDTFSFGHLLVWCFASNAHIFRPSASAARPTLAKMSSAFRCQRKGRGLAL